MAIPSFSKFLRPTLEIVAERNKIESARKKMRDPIIEKMAFSEKEAAERLNSGGSRLLNRIGWALTYLKKAGLIEFPVRGTAQITDQGMRFLNEHQGEIKIQDLAAFESFQEFKQASVGSNDKSIEISKSSDEIDPESRIEEAISEIKVAVSSELLEKLRSMDPTDFEQVVLDLLGEMGYGINMGKLERTGGGADAGIDGIIHLDRLGLDKIYLQAKRWKEENVVGRPAIQGFFGAISGKRANKGVFITTSKYSAEAIGFADSVSDSLVLIDGVQLSNLMIEFEVGVSATKTIKLPEIDSDYFE